MPLDSVFLTARRESGAYRVDISSKTVLKATGPVGFEPTDLETARRLGRMVRARPRPSFMIQDHPSEIFVVEFDHAPSLPELLLTVSAHVPLRSLALPFGYLPLDESDPLW